MYTGLSKHRPPLEHSIRIKLQKIASLKLYSFAQRCKNLNDKEFPVLEGAESAAAICQLEQARRNQLVERLSANNLI